MNRGWWKKDQIAEALRLRAARVSDAEIARRLDRTTLAITALLYRYGAEHPAMRAPTRARKRCLRCGRDFLSDGPCNRVCTPCKERPSWSSEQDYHVAI